MEAVELSSNVDNVMNENAAWHGYGSRVLVPAVEIRLRSYENTVVYGRLWGCSGPKISGPKITRTRAKYEHRAT